MFDTRRPSERSTPSRVRREVVSYVRRTPRMNLSQLRNWDSHAQHYVVPVAAAERETSIAADATLDLPALFGRTSPLIVEIGSGTGDALVALATARPDVDILAFEVFQPGVATTLGKLSRAGADNVRIVMADGVQGLRHLIPDAGLLEVRLFFPDPWHKARHHKRRIVTRSFADLVAAKLAAGGRWLLATDWQDYADQMRAVLDGHERFANQYPDGWAPRPDDRPITKFEQRGLDAGRVVLDLSYRRLP